MHRVHVSSNVVLEDHLRTLRRQILKDHKTSNCSVATVVMLMLKGGAGPGQASSTTEHMLESLSSFLWCPICPPPPAGPPSAGRSPHLGQFLLWLG